MISKQSLTRWVKDVREGRRSVEALIKEMQRLPYEDLGFARLDTHRRLRRGLPEFVYCDGKTPAHLIKITERMRSSGELVILTRLNAELFKTIKQKISDLQYNAMAQIAYLRPSKYSKSKRGCVTVVTGGTSDLPIAEEAALTLELLGSRVVRVNDVGVAGIHRLFDQWDVLRKARVIIVIAGMEGALASVVAGLVDSPVIAVPTSVGYGASFKGIAPLLTMLNSCVPGIGTVNIDNGFGAAYLAHLINAPLRRRL